LSFDPSQLGHGPIQPNGDLLPRNLPQQVQQGDLLAGSAKPRHCLVHRFGIHEAPLAGIHLDQLLEQHLHLPHHRTALVVLLGKFVVHQILDGSRKGAIGGSIQFGQVAVAGPEGLGAGQFRHPGREGVIEKGQSQLHHLDRPGRLEIHADAEASEEGQPEAAPSRSEADGPEAGS